MEKSGKVKQLSRDDVEFLMDANKFTYRKPLDSSLISTRQMRKYNFTPTNYIVKSGGDTQAEVVINSGSDYVSGPNSYITMTIETQKGDGSIAGSKFSKATGDGQSAFNLFKACELIHRSGDQIDYVRELNSLVQTLLKYENDLTFGGYVEAMGNDLDFGLVVDGNLVKQDVILPLRYFSGLFAQEALIPSNLIGGMRMRLEFEDILKALSGGANDVEQIKITNMAIVLDSLIPIDDVQAELRDAQANVKTQGLQYSYYSYYNIKKPVPNSEIDFNLNFSAGKVMNVILKSRKAQAAVDVDNIGGEQYPYSRIQARLGSLTFPQHELTSKAEAYTLTLRAFDALDCPDVIDPKKAAVGVPYSQYIGDDGVCVVTWDMERSSVLKLSGELTNNSRLLSINGGLIDAEGARVLSCWVKHFRVVNVQLDNVTVDR